MNERLEMILAYTTIALSIAIPTLHVVRAMTNRLRAYTLTTPEKWDDILITRVLRVLDGLDAIVDAISFVIPRGPRPLNPTPHCEAVEEEITKNERPTRRDRGEP